MRWRVLYRLFGGVWLAMAGGAAAWARPSLPMPADIAAAAGGAMSESPGPARIAAAAEPAGENFAPPASPAAVPPLPFLRAYEPVSVGYTVEEDQQFMDFTLSVMVPLLHGYYPDRSDALTAPGAERAGGRLRPYFAFTGRAGQYIGTRSSSPVVGKRFNPLLSARYWWWPENATARERADTYVEAVYGHESNGQQVSEADLFVATWEIRTVQEVRRLEEIYGSLTDELRAQALLTGYESARDEISRGWDYVGLNFSVRGGPWLPDENHRVQLKLTHYLDWGLLQKDKEEYAAWERDPEGRPRDRVDGIELRYDGRANFGRGRLLNLIEFSSEWALIWKTGIARPFHANTFEAELGLLINDFPVKLWYRHGYLHDLADYYRKETAGGLRFSFNRFTRDAPGAAQD